MAGASGIKAGQAYYSLFADSSQLVAGLKIAEARIKAFGSNVTAIGLKIAGIGGVAVAAFQASAKIFADTGSALGFLSQRTGASVESLSRLSYAASITDTNIQSVQGAFQSIQSTLNEVRTGNIDAARSLLKLGLSYSGLKSLSPEQQLGKIADALQGIQDPGRKAAAMMEVLGTTDLGPLLAGGSKGLKEMGDEAQRLGLVMSGADAQSAMKLNKSFVELYATLKQVAVSIGAAIAPAVIKTNTLIRDIAVSVGNWVKKNPALINTLFQIAKAAAVAGAVLIGVGQVIGAAGSAVGFLSNTIKSVVSVFGQYSAGALAAIGAIVGIGTGATAAAGAAFYFSGAWKVVWDEVSRIFTNMRTIFDETWGGIRDALSAGDLELAGRVALAGLNVAFIAGCNEVSEYWRNFKDGLVTVAIDIGAGISKGFITAFENVLTAFAQFQETLEIGWNIISGNIEKIFVRFKALAGINPLALLKGPQAAGQAVVDAVGAGNTAAAAVDKRTEDKNNTLINNSPVRGRIAAIQAAAGAARGAVDARAEGIKSSFTDASGEALKRGMKNFVDAQRELAGLRKEAADKAPGPGKIRKTGGMNALPEVLKAGSVGTFNGQAIGQSLSGGNAMDRIARATEKSAQYNKDLLAEVRNSDGFVWGN